MPNAALSAYLAKNYLDGAKADMMMARAGGQGGSGSEKKKRKKKRADGGGEGDSGLRMVDDGDDTWKQRQDSDEEAAVVVVNNEEEMQIKKGNRWNRLGGQAFEEVKEEEADEKPQMAGGDGLDLDTSMQNAIEQELIQQQQQEDVKPGKKNTIRSGLRSKGEMRAERLERERKVALQSTYSKDESAQEEVEEAAAQRRKKEREEKAQETVYRDASGRRIDVQRDDEERKLIKEQELKREREKKDWNKGQTQIELAKAARKREEEERHTSFARYSSDERMNQQLREIQRESDPALGFLTKKQSAKGPQKPTYKGSFPPNRFKIRPGYRWDGVERSNGFESKFFQKKHQRAQRKDDMDSWGKEDM